MMHKICNWGKYLVIVGILGFSKPITAGSTEKISTQHESFQRLVLQYVNQYRAKHHLAPLTMNRYASTEAYRHSWNMAHKKIGFGHGGFGGRYKRLYKHGKNCRGASENVAYYRMDAKQLVNGWISSPGHRRNILGHYNQTGIGIVPSSKKGWGYMTQLFLRCE